MKKGMWINAFGTMLVLCAASAAPIGAGAQSQNLDMDYLEDLVAPIALYPDPLIAQVLPASTFVEEMVGEGV
jgi:hypothetical protein